MNRILVVDDSVVVNTMLQEFLTTHGYEVVSAHTAEEAVQQVKRQRPDLIVLDVQLPDVGGFELCKFFRNRSDTRLVPIVMITATATQLQDKLLGFQAGADDYLTKPFDMNELLERIRALFRRSLATASPGSTGKKETPAVPHPAIPAGEVLTPFDAMSRILFTPEAWTSSMVYPALSLAYVVVLVSLLAIGVASAPGLSIRPLMVCLLAWMAFGFLVSVLVVTSSFVGIPLKWKEASRLLSLAGVPVLFKFAGGVVFAWMTSLSPFLFTASPLLVSGAWPGWLARLDLFELWALGLVALLLSKRPGMTRRGVIITVMVLWCAAVCLLVGFQKYGATL